MILVVIQGQETRKNVAKSHTRKMIVDALPSERIFEAYTGVNEVVVTTQYHKECTLHDIALPDSPPDPDAHLYACQRRCPGPRYTPPPPPPIYGLLEKLAIDRKSASIPLHVEIGLSKPPIRAFYSRYKIQRYLLKCLGSDDNPVPITYGFTDTPIDVTKGSAWVAAYILRAVVEFRQPDPKRLGQYAEAICNLLCHCTGSEQRGHPGRLILCDVPQLVLSPQELEAAGDTAEEAALVKIFDAWQSSPKPKWEIFTSRIKLVEGGYRRSLEEDAEDRKQK